MFSFALCLFFLIAGSGFNVVHYCCDVCAHEGIEHVASKGCQTIHTNSSTCCSHHFGDNHENDTSCETDDLDFAIADVHQMSDNCDIIHVTVDVPTISNALNVDFKLHFDSLALPFATFEPLLSNIPFFNNDLSPPDIIFFHSGRALLLKKDVLTIWFFLLAINCNLQFVDKSCICFLWWMLIKLYAFVLCELFPWIIRNGQIQNIQLKYLK